MPLRKQQVMYLAIAGVVLAVSIGLGVVYCGIRSSLTAERALHTNLLVVAVVREYVVDHNGAWPRCWQDLEPSFSRRRAMFGWPEDGEDVRRYVSVDFEADPDKLATQSVEQFVAIQPQGPCYPYKDHPEVARLLDAIRQSRRAW